jgi:predicted DCC family thiol-disulfide oxidoreductase YuxK
VTLTVLYDAHCGLCRWCRDRLSGAAQLTRLRFVAAGSHDARARFPGLDHEASMASLTVVGDRGQVYRGLKAWTMVLWALEDGREWAIWFTTPLGRPVLRMGVALVEALRITTACDGACSAGRGHAPPAERVPWPPVELGILRRRIDEVRGR